MSNDRLWTIKHGEADTGAVSLETALRCMMMIKVRAGDFAAANEIMRILKAQTFSGMEEQEQ